MVDFVLINVQGKIIKKCKKWKEFDDISKDILKGEIKNLKILARGLKEDIIKSITDSEIRKYKETKIIKCLGGRRKILRFIYSGISNNLDYININTNFEIDWNRKVNVVVDIKKYKDQISNIISYCMKLSPGVISKVEMMEYFKKFVDDEWKEEKEEIKKDFMDSFKESMLENNAKLFFTLEEISKIRESQKRNQKLELFNSTSSANKSSNFEFWDLLEETEDKIIPYEVSDDPFDIEIEKYSVDSFRKAIKKEVKEEVKPKIKNNKRAIDL